MNNTSRRNLYIFIALVVVAGFITYRVMQTNNAMIDDDFVVEEVAQLREYSATNSYDIPGGSHTLTFTISVNSAGEVEAVKGLDLTDPEHQVRVDEFSETVTTIIKGKKLSELEAIDKVGTSSLTTDSFNAALAEIKAQI